MAATAGEVKAATSAFSAKLEGFLNWIVRVRAIAVARGQRFDQDVGFAVLTDAVSKAEALASEAESLLQMIQDSGIAWRAKRRAAENYRTIAKAMRATADEYRGYARQCEKDRG